MHLVTGYRLRCNDADTALANRALSEAGDADGAVIGRDLGGAQTLHGGAFKLSLFSLEGADGGTLNCDVSCYKIIEPIAGEVRTGGAIAIRHTVPPGRGLNVDPAPQKRNPRE